MPLRLSRGAAPLADIVAYADEFLRIREVPTSATPSTASRWRTAGTVSEHRGRGGCLAGHDRRRCRSGIRSLLRAPRAALGRKRSRHRPALPPGRHAAGARHRPLRRPHPARPPSRGRQQRRAGRPAGHRGRGLVRRLQGEPDRRLGLRPGPADLAGRPRRRGESRARHLRARRTAHPRAAPSGSPGSASSPAAPAA